VCSSDLPAEPEVVENSDVVSERELELQRQLEEYQQKDTKREAEAFADGEIREGRAFPAEREALIALFTQAVLDDKSTETKVSFKNGEEVMEASRVDALKALYSFRKPHNLTYEEIADANANVLVANYSNDDNDLAEAEKQAREYAARRNKANN